MSVGARRASARLAAVQALYELEVSGKGVLEAVAEFESHWLGQTVEEVEGRPADAGFFRDIVAGVVREQRMLDPKIDAALAKSWPLRRVEAVLRAILRAGAFELYFRPDVPARVAITEYVKVADAFYAGDEPGMVNAVLDHLGRDARADELVRRHG